MTLTQGHIAKAKVTVYTWQFLCRLGSIATHRDHFVRRPSVCPSACHTLLSHFPKLCFAGDTCIPRNAATSFAGSLSFMGIGMRILRTIVVHDSKVDVAGGGGGYLSRQDMSTCSWYYSKFSTWYYSQMF